MTEQEKDERLKVECIDKALTIFQTYPNWYTDNERIEDEIINVANKIYTFVKG